MHIIGMAAFKFNYLLYAWWLSIIFEWGFLYRDRVMASKQQIYLIKWEGKKRRNWMIEEATSGTLATKYDTTRIYILWHRCSFTSTFIVRISTQRDVPFFTFLFLCCWTLILFVMHFSFSGTHVRSPLSLQCDSLVCSNQIATCSWKLTAPKAERKKIGDELVEVLRCCCFITVERFQPST